MCMHPCSPPLFQNYRMKHQAIDIAFFYAIHPLSLIQYRGHSGDGAYPSCLIGCVHPGQVTSLLQGNRDTNIYAYICT